LNPISLPSADAVKCWTTVARRSAIVTVPPQQTCAMGYQF
jgi:hypothetical protein